MFIYLHYLYVLVYLSCCIYLLVHLYILFTPSPFIYYTLYCFLYCPIYIYIYRNLGTIYIYICCSIYLVVHLFTLLISTCLFFLLHLFTCSSLYIVHPLPFYTHTHAHILCYIIMFLLSLSSPKNIFYPFCLNGF